MIHAVEERGQVDIDHLLIALPKILTHLLHGLVRVSPRPEPKAVVAELTLLHRTQHLRDRLLNHAIRYVWNPQRALIAIRFGYPHAAHRMRLIGSFP